MELFKIYPTLDSTNKELARIIAAGTDSHGMSIMALQQTLGSGQYGRRWHAAKDKHLALSILYKPSHVLATSLPAISMKVSLVLARMIQSLVPHLQPLIKWPNDIYVGEKKLAGILIENTLQGNRLQHSIIGIGVNINEEEFPPDIPHATSMYLLTHQRFDLELIAKELAREVLSLLNESSSEWKSAYDAFVYGKGQHAAFELHDQRINAVVQGIGMDGKLMLQHGDETKSYFAHELKWII